MKDKLPERYCYPAVFTYEDGEEIAVVFPDLKCATSGENDKDAWDSAKELLQLTMFGLEEDGEPIPEPSKIMDIQKEENETVALIEVYMPAVRAEQNSKSVNRTVTLPAWMNAQAMEYKINFSLALQDALREKYHIVKKD
jgi:predicted RNase H-like HicB family nuclease